MKIFFIIGAIYFIIWYLVFAIFPVAQWSAKLLLFKFKETKKIFDFLAIFTAFYLFFYKFLLLIWLIFSIVYFYNKDNGVFSALILFVTLGVFKFLTYWVYPTESQLQITRASAILNIIIIITYIILLVG